MLHAGNMISTRAREEHSLNKIIMLGLTVLPYLISLRFAISVSPYTKRLLRTVVCKGRLMSRSSMLLKDVRFV